MITVSLCMIVKNEEETLAGCLSSVAGLVEEIIIVDTGSNDRTKEIAAGFTDKIYDFAWVDDFSAARNFSFAQATMDYILWLDADDMILPGDAQKLRELKETLPHDVNVVMMRYNTGFDGEGRVTFSYFRERLCKRDCYFQWREPVHEYLEAAGERISADICVTHVKPSGRTSGDRNLNIYESRLSRGEQLSPRGMFYYARELKEHRRYDDAVKWFRLFLDQGQGWVEDNISACADIGQCYLAQKQPAEALSAMLYSFNYDTPRAEICCKIAYFFKERGMLRQAAFWFGLILSLERNEQSWGFYQEDCWGYIPCLELAVCYDQLGQYEKAERFNEMAATYKPDSAAVSHNRKYFAMLKNQQT